jgi:hypothetical protein
MDLRLRVCGQEGGLPRVVCILPHPQCASAGGWNAAVPSLPHYHRHVTPGPQHMPQSTNFRCVCIPQVLGKVRDQLCYSQFALPVQPLFRSLAADFLMLCDVLPSASGMTRDDGSTHGKHQKNGSEFVVSTTVISYHAQRFQLNHIWLAR